MLASAHAHTHLLAALPPGTFPGVDDREIFGFLEERSADLAFGSAAPRTDGVTSPRPR